MEETNRALAEAGHPLPQVEFGSDATSCPRCGDPLGVYAVPSRKVTSLAHGGFEAKEKLLRCDAHAPQRKEECPTLESDELARVVPDNQSFAYDLIVHVGLARYLEGKRRDKIQEELLARGIEVSTGSISNLCDRFLVYLERLHLLRAPQLREAMSAGYALHLDATCEKGKGGHFICMDGIRHREGNRK